MKLVSYLVLLAFLPLILFMAGAAYGYAVDAAFSTSCVKSSAPSAICTPVHLLTFGGFMPAAMILTVPCSMLLGIALIVRRLVKSRRENE